MWVSKNGAAVGRVLLAAISLLGLLSVAASEPRAQAARREWPPASEPEHRAHMVIPPQTSFPITRKVTIGLDKSMLIELPVDLQNVLVSNPDVVDAVVQSPRQVYLLAKDVGEANAFFMGKDGQRLVFLELSVTRDLTPLNDALNRLLPGARIKAEAVGDNVVLTGSVINPIDSTRAADMASRYSKKRDSVVNMLSVAAREQVLLRVQVTEMHRDSVRRLGISMPGAVIRSGNVTFTRILSERAGVMRTLAEPNLTAISGETAKFLAGGEFPVPIVTQDRQVSVAWKSFGVNVAFKPVVMTEGRISLTISAEVSELSSQGAVTVNDISVPALKVRRAETTLELPSGGTLAMAGLLSDDVRQSVRGVPGLKDIAILGALFRSTEYQREESELVILVTPYMANHAPRSEFGRPDGGYAPSSSLKELLFGHLNRIYGSPGYRPHGRYEGDVGFIVDYPDSGVKP
jgi:pilus assembly protein CpaC